MNYDAMIETVVKIAKAYKQYDKIEDYKSAKKHLYQLVKAQYESLGINYNVATIRQDVGSLLA